jgi:hypothetical protein
MKQCSQILTIVILLFVVFAFTTPSAFAWGRKTTSGFGWNTFEPTSGWFPSASDKLRKGKIWKTKEDAISFSGNAWTLNGQPVEKGLVPEKTGSPPATAGQISSITGKKGAVEFVVNGKVKTFADDFVEVRATNHGGKIIITVKPWKHNGGSSWKLDKSRIVHYEWSLDKKIVSSD